MDSVDQIPTSLALEAANTWVARRGRPQDTIRGAGELLAWLKRHVLGPASLQPSADEAELNAFRELREAIRSLAGAIDAGDPPDAAAVDTLNAIAARAPIWPVLVAEDGELHMSERTATDYLANALATVARDAMTLFTGPTAPRISACGAPGCVQFFLKDHPRRRWCCPECGNRARAARYYQRHHRPPRA